MEWQRSSILLIITGLLLGAVGLLQVSADERPPPATVIPYQGYLEHDGQPINAQGEEALSLLFAIYSDPLCDGVDEQLVYSETQSVELFAGQFSVILGQHDSEGYLTTAVNDSVSLCIGITVLGDTAEETIELSGRQRLVPAPVSTWAIRSKRLTVETDLNVGGVVDTGGINFPYRNWEPDHVGDGAAAIRNDQGTYNSLIIAGNNSAGGARQVSLWDDVHVSGELDVDGNISGEDMVVLGDMTVQGYTQLNQVLIEGRYIDMNQGLGVYRISPGCSGEGGYYIGRPDSCVTTLCALNPTRYYDCNGSCRANDSRRCYHRHMGNLLLAFE
ncbi:MAG: hypothetical protein AAFX99_11915 [Myxococcota bacterium]